MPGLLQTPDSAFGTFKSISALVAEFLGTMFFAFGGTTTPQGSTTQQNSVSNPAQANWAPWGNGMTLAILVYTTANISGGHLNPAVTAGTIVTGHISLWRGLGYILAQLSGACFGILLVAGVVPGVHVGMGDNGVGCFHKAGDISLGQLFAWELILTFIFVSVVYAVAIGEPSFGIVGPLIVGLALFALVFVGSAYTGTSVNPARSFGPAAVFHCYWNEVWLYCIAEFSGGILAGIIAGPLYGVGAPWIQALVPWMHTRERLDASSGRMVSDDHPAPEHPAQNKIQSSPSQWKFWKGRDQQDHARNSEV